MPKFKVYARERIICEYIVDADSMEDAETGAFSIQSEKIIEMEDQEFTEVKEIKNVWTRKEVHIST